MTTSRRAVLGFVAAVLSVLVFHQGMIALLHAAGAISSAPYSVAPVGPLAVPRIVDLCFWGGLYGLVFGLVLPGLPKRPMWLMGLVLGLVAVCVGWFVVAPLKGLPVASGWSPKAMLLSLVINGFWGLGVGLLVPLLMPRTTRSAARRRPRP